MALSICNATLPPGAWSPFADRRVVRIDTDDGRIVAVSDGPAPSGFEVIDAAGGCVLPGLVDAHTHLGWAGEDLWTVRWDGVRTRVEALAQARTIMDRVPNEFWVLGGDWLPESLADRELPRLDELDVISGEQPLLLVSRDRSRAVLNSEALRRCRICQETADPEGGRIERDEDGEPTGRLFGEAVWARLAVGAVPPRNHYRQTAELEAVLADLVSRGVTEIHDIGTYPEEEAALPINLERSFTDVGLLEDLAERGRLPLRVSYRPSLLRVHELGRLATAPADGGLITFAGFKMSLDNGWFSEPSGPRVDSFRYPGKERAMELCHEADKLGAAVSIHAIGDLGVAEALDLLGSLPCRRDTALPPHRVVHARRMAVDDIQRCAALGAIVEVQPWEIVGAGRILRKGRREEFTRLLSPFRALLDAGVRVIFGSDRRLGMRTDLRDCDPLVGIQVAVTRRDPTRPDDEAFQSSQAITVSEALNCSTRAPVEAVGGATLRGRIVPGAAADLVVLGDDPTRVDPEAIAQIPVWLTQSAGRIVWQGSGR